MNLSTRRDFLRVSIAGLGTFLLPFHALSLAAGAGGANNNFPREIGAAFLRTRDSQSKAIQIKQAIERIRSESEMRAFIEKSIENDFRAGACFSYNQWQLSNTEGALCALYGS